MAFGNFGRTGEGFEAGDLLAAKPAGQDRHQPVADEAAVVLVAGDHLPADEFARNHLKQVRAHAGVRFAERGGEMRQRLPQFVHVPESRQNAAGVGEFVIAEVIARELALVEQSAHAVIKAFGTQGFDEVSQILSGHVAP